MLLIYVRNYVFKRTEAYYVRLGSTVCYCHNHMQISELDDIERLDNTCLSFVVFRTPLPYLCMHRSNLRIIYEVHRTDHLLQLRF